MFIDYECRHQEHSFVKRPIRTKTVMAKLEEQLQVQCKAADRKPNDGSKLKAWSGTDK